MSQTDTTTVAAPPLTPATLLATLQAAALGGVTSSITEVLQDLDADTIGFVGEEAQDFDTLLTQFVEGVEAGQTPAAAWSTAFANFETAERSQLWTEWTSILSQVSTVFNGWVTALKAAL